MKRLLFIVSAVVSVALIFVALAQQTFPVPVELDSRAYNFVRIAGDTNADRNVTGNLSASGSGKVLTFAKCPAGFAVGGYVYIAGGTGTAETAAITATTCGVAGGASGTITVTTANTHVGQWRVTSSTSGIAEALVAARPTDASVAIAPGVNQARSTISLLKGDYLSCAADSADRWRSGVYPCRINYTGTGDLFSVVPGAGLAISSVSIKGLSLSSTTGRYAFNFNAGGGGAIFGVRLEDIHVGDDDSSDYSAEGWTSGIKSAGTVFDVTCNRCTIVDTQSHLVDINNATGEAGGPNQWKFFDSYLIPTANSTWAVKAIGAAEADVIGTISFIDTTIAEAAPTGANGIWIHGGLWMVNSLVEGNGAKAGTVGIRMSSTSAPQVLNSVSQTWDVNVQIGDPTHATWVAADSVFRGRAIAGGTDDIQIVAGGSRVGTRIECHNSACDIGNLRESTDGVYSDVQYDNTSSGTPTVDLRDVGMSAGAVTVRRRAAAGLSQLTVQNAPNQDASPANPPLQLKNAAGTVIWRVYPNGSIGVNGGVTFATLPATADWSNSGTFLYCSDCTIASAAPHACTGTGTGAWAFATPLGWKCPF